MSLSPSPSTPQPSPRVSLPTSYLDSTFRVVAVVPHPTNGQVLVVAGERSPVRCGSANEPEKCGDDSSCGSIYLADRCYFFTEDPYRAGASPFPNHLATWRSPDDVDGLVIDSIRFRTTRMATFVSAGGDGGFVIWSRWRLNLSNGRIIRLESHRCGTRRRCTDEDPALFPPPS